MSKKRVERDVLGKVNVPYNAYYGSFTARALKNFQISGLKTHPQLIKSLAYVKKASALTNSTLKLLDKKKAKAIVKASDEIIKDKFKDQFNLDVYQAGAGTPINMNINEVIANRATQILGGKLGQYIVHPNNDVNMAQSTNDVIPTAIRITSIFLLKNLNFEIKKFDKSLRNKSKKFKKILKTGRTHLEDAVPMTLGQEFEGYADCVNKNINRLKNSSEELRELGIGGTAIGTGINTNPKFRKLIVKNISKITNIKFYPTKNPIELTNSMDVFVNVSGSLRILAIDLFKIANNLSILNSGPKTSIGEIILPEVEPGSSIMPGKINPSIPEAVIMACFQVLGNDHVIQRGSQYSTLQLNVMSPVIGHNLFSSIELLTNSLITFRKFCIEGIKADSKRCIELLNNSFSFATALNPYLGYEVVSEIVHKALNQNKTLKEIILKNRILDEKDLNNILDPKNMIAPKELNKNLIKKIKKSENFKRFVKKI